MLVSHGVRVRRDVLGRAHPLLGELVERGPAGVGVAPPHQGLEPPRLLLGAVGQGDPVEAADGTRPEVDPGLTGHPLVGAGALVGGPLGGPEARAEDELAIAFGRIAVIPIPGAVHAAEPGVGHVQRRTPRRPGVLHGIGARLGHDVLGVGLVRRVSTPRLRIPDGGDLVVEEGIDLLHVLGIALPGVVHGGILLRGLRVGGRDVLGLLLGFRDLDARVVLDLDGRGDRLPGEGGLGQEHLEDAKRVLAVRQEQHLALRAVLPVDAVVADHLDGFVLLGQAEHEARAAVPLLERLPVLVRVVVRVPVDGVALDEGDVLAAGLRRVQVVVALRARRRGDRDGNEVGGQVRGGDGARRRVDLAVPGGEEVVTGILPEGAADLALRDLDRVGVADAPRVLDELPSAQRRIRRRSAAPGSSPGTGDVAGQDRDAARGEGVGRRTALSCRSSRDGPELSSPQRGRTSAVKEVWPGATPKNWLYSSYVVMSSKLLTRTALQRPSVSNRLAPPFITSWRMKAE